MSTAFISSCTLFLGGAVVHAVVGVEFYKKEDYNNDGHNNNTVYDIEHS